MLLCSINLIDVRNINLLLIAKSFLRDYFIDLKESYAEETEMLLFNVNMASMFTPLSIVEASFRALKIHVYEARESKHTLV